MLRSFAWAFGGAVCLLPPIFSQTPAKIDFARDVQPILRQNCIGCHGPNQQKNGLRVDRRSSVIKPGSRRVQPGSPENSLLYHRLTSSEYGLQMPPTGPLRPEQVEVIRAWIEQGAEWPDALANEKELPPLEPRAISLVETLRTDRRAFEKAVAADPKLLNARGPEGSTPFMYAVLYTDGPALERLIRLGADVNRRNDAGATALLWAAVDLEKTRVLVAHGAEVNAKSADARTPLMVAAGRTGGLAIVKLLLEHGANVNPTVNPGAESSPLLEAAMAGEPEILQALLEKGASLKDIGGMALSLAAGADCGRCIDLLAGQKLDAEQYTIALQQVVVLDNPKLIRMALEHGANVNAADPTGRTALMYAAVSDLLPVEQVKMLIDRGAELNAKAQRKGSGDSGLTALDLARMHGNTAVVELLLKAGAKSALAEAPPRAAAMRRGNTIEAAIPASLPLLQRADASFMPKAGCFSCHNNSLTAMAVGMARKKGFRVDEKIAGQQVHANAGALAGIRDIVHQGFFVPDLNSNPEILAYVLLGLGAEGYKGDLSTDAVAMFLLTHQMADGRWAVGPEARPPLCTETALGQTVLAMRGLQLYAPPVDEAQYAQSIQRAADWIVRAKATTNYDLAWQLQGLAWAGTKREAMLKARRELLAVQRSDGGWGDLASMESSAYTTGLAMVALESSGLPVSDAAYRRGVEYLLRTQLEDGSWHVHTRAAGFQPYFDNGFPHGADQWISAAGTSMATLALTLAAPAAGARTAAGPAEQR